MKNYQLKIQQIIDNKVVDYMYIRSEQMLSVQIENNAFPNYSKLVLTLKPHKSFIDLIPTKYESKLPFIITWFNEQLEIQEVFFILSKEYIKETKNEYVIFQGGSFGVFEDERLVVANVGYDNTDDEDLPDDFATYNKSGSIKTILDDLYNKNFIFPVKPTFGALPYEYSEPRQVKGMQSVVNEDVDVTTTINVDYATTFTETKEKLFNQTSTILEIYADIIDDRIFITNKQGEKTNFDTVRRTNEILKNGYGVVSKTNAILGTANPNNYTYLTELEDDEFTVREVTNDSAFINGSNATYLENTTITQLATEKKERLLKILELKDTSNEYRAGDYINFENTTYRINSITYSITNSTFSKTLSIEEE